MQSREDLHLKESRWFVCLFFWSLEVWEKFAHNQYEVSRYYVRRGGTNRCAFIKMITMQMPLVFLAQAVLLAAVITALFYVPNRLFGWGGAAGSVGTLASAILLFYILRQIRSWIENRNSKKLATARFKSENTPELVKFKEIGFVRLLIGWLVDIKLKLCPRVTFYNENEEVEQNA